MNWMIFLPLGACLSAAFNTQQFVNTNLLSASKCLHGLFYCNQARTTDHVLVVSTVLTCMTAMLLAGKQSDV